MGARLRSFVIALLIAAVLGTITGIVVPDICKTLTPDDWFLWWLYDCDKGAPGGGGGGAG